MNTKQKNFVMSADDVEWLTEVRETANKGRLGKISLSVILSDILAWCKEKGYKFRG